MLAKGTHKLINFYPWQRKAANNNQIFDEEFEVGADPMIFTLSAPVVAAQLSMDSCKKRGTCLNVMPWPEAALMWDSKKDGHDDKSVVLSL